MYHTKYQRARPLLATCSLYTLMLSSPTAWAPSLPTRTCASYTARAAAETGASRCEL